MITGDKDKIIAYLCTQNGGGLYDLSPHKEKRSLNQNSYYWKLVGEIAKKVGVSSAMVHNRNLRDLGLLERIDGQLIPIYLPDTNKAEIEALNADTYHIKPTSQVKAGKGGELYRCYVMLRNSHTFDTADFTALLNLCIQEAKQLDIEVLPPEQLEHLRQLAGQAEKRKRGN